MLQKALILGAVVSSVLAGPNADADKVASLPDIGTISGFEMYSGYLGINDQKELHYVFVTSQNDPSTDPVIVWFNGGPGCSSMEGFFEEHGPFVQHEGDAENWYTNEYAWNMFGNILYIESPAGVGYSVCGTECEFDDDSSADDNLVALLYFYEALFPEYLTNELYISGESYAGIYVPYLVDRIDRHNSDSTQSTTLNLVGFMVGNGVTNYEIETYDKTLEMEYWHTLYSDDVHDGLINNGCYEQLQNLETMGLSLICTELIAKVELGISNINPYNLYGECFTADDQLLKEGRELSSEFWTQKVSLRSDYTKWAWKYKGHEKRLRELPPCTWGQPLIDYLRRSDVMTALHVSSNANPWDLCTDAIDYNKLEVGSQWVYQRYHGKYRMLKYSGDTDGVVPTFGTLAWIEDYVTRLKLSQLTMHYPYYYVDEVAGAQVAGFFTEYEGGFSFATVHGAGHMVPTYKPQQSFVLFSNWIKGLNPPHRDEV